MNVLLITITELERVMRVSFVQIQQLQFNQRFTDLCTSRFHRGQPVYVEGNDLGRIGAVISSISHDTVSIEV